MNVVFFGSTSDSVIIFSSLYAQSRKLTLHVAAVVTQPPKPVGRARILTPTPVEAWAKRRAIPVVAFPSDPDRPSRYQDERSVIDTLQQFNADILIAASYGQKIPAATITAARYGGLNVHPSILPRWRGADPVPWAMIAGDRQTGVTIITLSQRYDSGTIIAQEKIPIAQNELANSLRTKLFTIGAQLLVDTLPRYLGNTQGVSSQHTPGVNISAHPRAATRPQPYARQPYARRFTRDDGFLPWELIQAAMNAEPVSTIELYSHVAIIKDYMRYQTNWKQEQSLAALIDRFHRALAPWPGVWTLVRGSRIEDPKSEEKRLKILSVHLDTTLDARRSKLVLYTVQLEGKKPVSFRQFASAHLRSLSS